MKNTVLIFTESGSDIGFGHLSRCSAISVALRKKGLEPRMMVASNLTHLKLSDEIEYVDWYFAPDAVVHAARSAAFIILDSFIASLSQIEFFQAVNPNIVVIDDYPHRAYRAGVVVDWTVGAEAYAFPVKNPEVTYLLGCSYCALREEFESPSTRQIKPIPLRALITLGGSDIRALTIPLVSHIKKMDAKIHIDVVVGNGVQNFNQIEALHEERVSIYKGCSAKQMKQLMAHADFAVCGGGQTLYEAASQGLPALTILLAEDQERDIAGFVSRQAAYFIGEWDSATLMADLNHRMKEIYSPMVREKMTKNAQQCIDGHGAARLASTLVRIFSSNTINALPFQTI